MTERELLELAAKAAGIKIDPIDAMHEPDDWECWNPLQDDGDALRLAVKLGLSVHFREGKTCIYYDFAAGDVIWDECPRLAITRAAAEIGRNMP